MSGPAVHVVARDAMATRFEVRATAGDPNYVDQAAAAAFEVLDALQRAFSRFIAASDVSAVGRLAPGETARVEIDTLRCLQVAEGMRRATAGAFDVSLGTAGEGGLVLDPDAVAVGVAHDGVRLDLGGIGKGYALDRMAEVLADWGVADALVHGGWSTALAGGSGPEGAPWTVALRHPDGAGRPLGRVTLGNRAVAGSGRADEHVVDPRTGRRMIGRAASWALAPTAAEADALSTALLVLAPDEIEAFFVAHAGRGGIVLGETDARPHLFGDVAGLDLHV